MKNTAFNKLWITLTAIIGLTLSLGLATAQQVQVEIIEETDEYRVVQHALGTTRVPANPQRVVTIHSSHLDNAVALGVTPVGAGVLPGSTLEYSHPEYLQDALAEVTSVGNWITPNLEAILALNPDFILANSFHAEIYDQLSRIAPTAIVEQNGISGLREVAEVLGRTEKAEEVIAKYEQTVAEARETLADAIESGQKVAFLRVRSRSIRLYGNPAGEKYGVGYVLYNELGLEPAVLVVNDEGYTTISLELLPQMNANHLFVLVQDESAFSRITDTPLWNTIPAVQKGQVYPLPYGMWQGSTRVQGMMHFAEYATEMITSEGN